MGKNGEALKLIFVHRLAQNTNYRQRMTKQTVFFFFSLIKFGQRYQYSKC